MAGIPNILSGATTTPGSTIITIPANSIWRGTVTLSAAVVVASGAAAQKAFAVVTVNGTTTNPPAGDYVRIDLHAPQSATSGVGTQDSGTLISNLTVSSGASPATLTLGATNTTAQSAAALGELI